MRILADENMPGDAVAMIRSRGHDVLWIRTDSPGATDEANLAKAVAEQRLLITFDKDFGDLVFRRGHAASCGVVLFRITTPSSAAVATRIADTLDSHVETPSGSPRTTECLDTTNVHEKIQRPD